MGPGKQESDRRERQPVNNTYSHEIELNKNYNSIGKMEKTHSVKTIQNYETDFFKSNLCILKYFEM